jgi:hypothetical protein
MCPKSFRISKKKPEGICSLITSCFKYNMQRLVEQFPGSTKPVFVNNSELIGFIIYMVNVVLLQERQSGERIESEGGCYEKDHANCPDAVDSAHGEFRFGTGGPGPGPCP